MRALRSGPSRFDDEGRRSDEMRLFVAYFPIFLQSFSKSARVLAAFDSDAPGRSCSDWAGSLGKQQFIDEASHLERRTSTQLLNRSILHVQLPPPLPRSYRTSGQGCHIPFQIPLEESVKRSNISYSAESWRLWGDDTTQGHGGNELDGNAWPRHTKPNPGQVG